jgi:hypothetical protein
VAFLVAVLEPIYALLKRTDGATPMMGKFYWEMYKLGDELGELFKEGTKWAKIPAFAAMKEPIIEKHGSRWVYMHCDYHSCGYALNPNFITHDVNTINDGEVFAGVRATLKRHYHDDPDSYKAALRQYNEFREQHFPFGDESAAEMAEELPAHEWWQMFGGATPELRKVACKVLSKVSSASSCERNWSAFDAIQTPKRTRLHHSTITSLVYARSNLRLEQKLSDPNYKHFLANWDSDAVAGELLEEELSEEEQEVGQQHQFSDLDEERELDHI